MNFREAASYLDSLVNYERKNEYPYKQSFKLGRVKNFLALLGNPQDSFKSLHVAGTKGKGSACVFLAYILRAAGFKVGLYTSPHLEDIRERIRILAGLRVKRQGLRNEFEGMISRKEFARLVGEIKPKVEKYNKVSKSGPLTFFEVLTVLAFIYFKNKKIDYAVLETGLGGRLDATNVVEPVVCGITPISYDHMDKLGATLRQISREKAGIIKKGLSGKGQGLIVVSAKQGKEAAVVIQERCKEKKAKLYWVGKDIKWSGHKKSFRVSSPAIVGAAQCAAPTLGNSVLHGFNVKGLKRNYRSLKIKLLGDHQLDNAAQAIGMIEALDEKKIQQEHIRAGLEKAIWPGRLEIAQNSPLVLLDGAQNLVSAEALKIAIKKYFSYQRLILVFGVSQDKDIKAISKVLFGIADEIILTKSQSPRAQAPEVIQKITDKPSKLTDNVRDAVEFAKSIAQPQDLILITGSLFVVGEARQALNKAAR